MDDNDRPGALTHATGAEMPYHSSEVGDFLIANWKPIGQIAATFVPSTDGACPKAQEQ